LRISIKDYRRNKSFKVQLEKTPLEPRQILMHQHQPAANN
jgi:hypothetical protein